MPMPEWFQDRWLEHVGRFNAILTCSRHGQEIFRLQLQAAIERVVALTPEQALRYRMAARDWWERNDAAFISSAFLRRPPAEHDPVVRRGRTRTIRVTRGTFTLADKANRPGQDLEDNRGNPASGPRVTA